jgi:hypothetical protein
MAISEMDKDRIVAAAERCEFFAASAERYREQGRADDAARSVVFAEADALLGFFLAGDRSPFAVQAGLSL